MRRDFARAAAEDQLSWAIRELASNLMRILAGGGKSHELVPQINAFIEAYAACEEAAASRLWHGTTRYVPKADRLLIKRLGFVWMEIVYDSRLQPVAADVSGRLHGAPASEYGDACKGA